MQIKEINWKKVKPVIGRWQTSEAHAGQVTYELIAEANDPYVITHFTVDFESETVSEGWREELGGHQERVPLTPEERAEAETMIKEVRSE